MTDYAALARSIKDWGRELGFQKVGHEWLVAWDCSKRLDPKYDRELTKTRRRCRDELAALAAIARDYRVKHDAPDGELPTVEQLAAKGAAELSERLGHRSVA